MDGPLPHPPAGGSAPGPGSSVLGGAGNGSPAGGARNPGGGPFCPGQPLPWAPGAPGGYLLAMPWTRVPVAEEVPEMASGLQDGRPLSYREALREALAQAMERDRRVFILGEGVDDPGGVFGTTQGLHHVFGRERVMDLPLAENGATGIALGASLAGMRPVLVHMRPDFLLLAMDQLVNHAAKWRYMFGGCVPVPLTIRAVIGRGWGSAAQHSQSLEGMLAHAPGLKVVMPSTPYDAKGCLIAAIASNSPVVCLEHRWLYDLEGAVPQEVYSIPLGRAVVRREGKDVTVVGVSYMALLALKAARALEKEGIEVEVIDLRTVKPLDDDALLASVRKTGRLVVADIGWWG